jgi:hypothetical protein
MSKSFYQNIKSNLIFNEKYIYLGKYGYLSFTNINIFDYSYIQDYVQSNFIKVYQYVKSGNITQRVDKISSYRIPRNQVYFEYQTLNEKNLVIIPKSIFDSIQKEMKDTWLIFHLYSSKVLDKNKLYTIDEMEEMVSSLTEYDKQVHWLWIRKPNTYLTNKIVKRCSSWIFLNPKFQMHLWTDLNNQSEYEDWISLLEPQHQELIRQNVKIHYKDEMIQMVKEFITKYESKLEYSQQILTLFETILSRKLKFEIIFKTDYIRNIILCMKGGIYTDFNDLICLYPIQYILPLYKNHYMVPVENNDLNNLSNYFMYTSFQNQEFIDYTIDSLSYFPKLYHFIHDQDIYHKSFELMLDILKQESITKEYLLTKNTELYDFMKINYSEFISSNNLQKEISTITINEQRFRKNYIDLFCLFFIDFFNQRGILLNDHFEYFQKLKSTRKTKKHKEIKTYKISDEALQSITEQIKKEETKNHYCFVMIDLLLQNVMNFTNLPIFMSKHKTELPIVPYSYLMRYMCFISIIGHLGDATSYGYDAKLDEAIIPFINE